MITFCIIKKWTKNHPKTTRCFLTEYSVPITNDVSDVQPCRATTTITVFFSF
jgi:hypothetical protein